jgi:hypothetical protein
VDSIPVRSKFYPRIAFLAVALLGAIESLYGSDQYAGDWISYLNVSRAVSALDLKGIFDPMWNPGYPILIALFRAFFPSSAAGEWYAIHLLNWILYLGFFAAWRDLIRMSILTADPTLAGVEDRPAGLWITTVIFLACTLPFDAPSWVCPDLAVSALFIFASAQTLRCLSRPTVAGCSLLGVTLAAGCWVKGIFVPFSFCFLFTLALLAMSRKLPWRKLAIVAGAFVLSVAPFVAGTSWSYGSFTFGVTGALNYAFHVNHLAHWTNWHGGPPQSGMPLHPTRQLIPDLPAFGFSTPFRTTYPPYNNMPYFYAGYRHFFSLRNQLQAIDTNCALFVQMARMHPFLPALILAILTVLLIPDWRRSLFRAPRALWLLFFPPFAGFAAYMLVYIEDRYITAFILFGCLFALLPLLDPHLRSKRVLTACLLAIYSLGAAAEFRVTLGHTFNLALHRQDFHQGEQWKIATAIPEFGLKGGDPVALIVDSRSTLRCSWAYSSRLRIVAEFGGLPMTLQPMESMAFYPSDPEHATTNYVVLFRGLSSALRTEVLEAFRREGAKAVVSYLEPQDGAELAGWKPIPGTTAWIYLFPR